MAERSGSIGEWNDADELESFLPFGHAQCLNKHTASVPLETVKALLQCAHVHRDMIFVHYAQVKLLVPSGSKAECIRSELEAMDLLEHVVIETEVLQSGSKQAAETHGQVQKLLFP